jgi:hypothetical protein
MRNPLKHLAPDKAQHAIAGAIAAAAGAVVVSALGVPLGAPLAGLLAALFAGAWKEFRDERANERAVAAGAPPPHDVSGADLLATVLGSLPVVIPLIVAAATRMVRHG